MVITRTAVRPAPVLPPKAVRSWLAVVQAYHLCDAAMTQRLAALGVTLTEHEVLANVLRHPGMSQQALAARCFNAKSHVSALVVALEKRGWLKRERHPDDARARRLLLTAAGSAIAQRTAAVQAQVVRAMSEAVSADEMALIEQAMQRVSVRLTALLSEA